MGANQEIIAELRRVLNERDDAREQLYLTKAELGRWVDREAKAVRERDEARTEIAILRPWSVMLKRAHGALTDAGCVVPLEFDQSIEHAIKDLARRATRAEQLFVDEYDARKAAERERDEALARLPVDGSHMPSIVDTLEDDNAALRAEIAELKARVVVLEAMKP